MDFLKIIGSPLEEKFYPQIFSGQLFCIQPTDAFFSQWRKKMAGILEEVFMPYHPTDAHNHIDHSRFIALLVKAREAIQNEQRDTVRQVFKSWGIDSTFLYWDKIILRAAPPVNFYEKRWLHDHVHAHRDTWGVNVQAQVNWWAPIYPIETNRTIRFYPHYWNNPMPNDTDSWSFSTYMQKKKAAKAGEKLDYKGAPSSLEEPKNGVAVVIEPDQCLVFSSAHLHDSIPNTSNKVRFSFEFRTLDKRHVIEGLGAPNVDNAGAKVLYNIYQSLETGERFTI